MLIAFARTWTLSSHLPVQLVDEVTERTFGKIGRQRNPYSDLHSHASVAAAWLASSQLAIAAISHHNG
jgi:hypothetical protein